MDKKSANGFQTMASEGGVQRKQLPYSVETPYGFHLDLDFLKYVDDIEKGNTIKRVHIQRRVKGPPKFSTLPRNFSLPGHGIRPVPKDSPWSGTSTLGPKPKLRLTEVAQISDLRANEGGTLSRGTAIQATSVVSARLRDEGVLGAPSIEEKMMATQARPNLLRASSMPITLQQRKGSDSSSPDRIVGTPENGSTENVFRASTDITERRCAPQERVGIHQQITVALKRVRELEDQVKTIPELKAQICSLRLEREQLLCQLQAQEKAQTSTLSKMVPCDDAGIGTQQQAIRQGFNLSLTPQLQNLTRKGVTEEKKPCSSEAGILLAKEPANQGLAKSLCQQESIIQTQLPEKGDQQKETVGSPLEHAGQEDGDATKGYNLGNSGNVQNLHEKLVLLEAKLLKASQELERTNDLLKEQIVENQVKEEKILQLSEGIRVELSPIETSSKPRRESIDTGTETEKVDYANRETETESPGTVDQGTDTERICIEVGVPQQRSGFIDKETEMTKVDTKDKVTEVTSEVLFVNPQLPVVNSMEHDLVTERATTKNQMTETIVATSEGETNYPERSRASSVDRGTETERVDTVDQVTETEVAQMKDHHTKTEVERLQNNNPVSNAETENHEVENTDNQRDEVHIRVSESEEGKKINERSQTDHKGNENVVVNVITDSSASVETSGIKEETVGSDFVNQTEESQVVTGEPAEAIAEENRVQNKSETKAILLLDSVETQSVEDTLSTVTVVVASERATVKTGVPVRPQRGRRPSADQSQPTHPQFQAAPVSSVRGSSEIHGHQSKTEFQSTAELCDPQGKDVSPTQSQSGVNTMESSCEKESESQPQTDVQSPSSSSKEVQIRPKSIQGPSKPTTRRDSKELKAPMRVSRASQPLRRGSSESHTHPTRRISSEVQTQSRRLSDESQPLKKEPELQTLYRGSSETAQHRSSGEAISPRCDIDESQQVRRGSSESPTSPAALGQVVTRITGLLGEQWAQLGSSSGAQPSVSQQKSPSTQKQMAGKSTEAGKGASAKPAGKAATAGKPTGKPGPSKMSSIQSQLVSSLSVLSAFYSPGPKAAANKQQDQGLRSIMKKNGAVDKQGNKGTKKNLKFVGVNGGRGRVEDPNTERYESTSSDESSGEEKEKMDVKGEGGTSEAEEEKLKEPTSAEKPEEGADAHVEDAGILHAEEGAVAAQKESSKNLLDPDTSQELLRLEDAGENVDKSFIDACLYVKDRMEEVTSPDKEMRQVLVVLYQEWFKVSSKKTSQADTVRLYLRQVGMTTPTLLPYVVNLTDGNGNMALHYSVSHSNFPVVKLLLDTGLCETDNVNKAGYTPVMLAALTAAETPDDLEVAQQLLRLGDVNACSKQMGQTALMLAVSHGRLAMVRLLLSCGAGVNAQDYEGSTALMCASEHGHTHIAGLLLETGHCDTSLTDKNGQTAKEVAEGSSHPDVVNLIKAHDQAESGH